MGLGKCVVARELKRWDDTILFQLDGFVFDPQKPFVASGVRIGTPSVTTRGMKEPQMGEIATLISDALEHKTDPAQMEEVRKKVLALTSQFPLYADLMERYS